MICIGIAVAQMILSAILGLIHGGVLGYFVAGINLAGIVMLAMGFGYYIRGEAIKEKIKERTKKTAEELYGLRNENNVKENGKHESELG